MRADFRFLVTSAVAMTTWALAGCFADPYADEVSPEDERVMHAMIDISCKLGVERLVISDRPAVPGHDAAGGNVRFGIDFERRIAHEARWPLGQICPAVRVVADPTIEDVLAHDTISWDKFIATFDGARSLMRISLPVYSPDQKRAVVYTSGSCPYTCGTGFYHELEKTHSGWRIVSSVVGREPRTSSDVVMETPRRRP